MRRLSSTVVFLCALTMAVVLGWAIAAVFPARAATVTETPAPPSIVCFVDDTRYTLNQFTEATPTRISLPTPTNLPTATATSAACVTRTVLNPVNVRAGAGTAFAVVGSLKAGAVVSVAEFRTISTGGVWMRLCGTNTWASATSAGVSP